MSKEHVQSSNTLLDFEAQQKSVTLTLPVALPLEALSSRTQEVLLVGLLLFARLDENNASDVAHQLHILPAPNPMPHPATL